MLLDAQSCAQNFLAKQLQVMRKPLQNVESIGTRL
jgi:hypothetical protein